MLFRDVLERESNAPKWRDMLNILRRLEARGEIRGGRFITGFSGEQFALPEAVESLRMSRRVESSHEITVAGADPMNLAGIVVPGPRTPAIPGRQICFRDGILLPDEPDSGVPNAVIATWVPTDPAPIAEKPALRLF